jgi:PII-like signaling protein
MLQIHLSERDKHLGKPLYEAIVAKCRELSIAGATVFRGLEGYGESAEIHRHHLTAHDQPIVVTIIDTEENIARLLPIVEEMMGTGLIAISDVVVSRMQKT